MKKFLLILLFLLLPFLNGKAQTNYPTRMYINWTLVGQPSWTIPSFYYCVTRSTYSYNGQYYFDVWFLSNSYSWDYYANTSTFRYVYLESVKVTYDKRYANYGKAVSFSFLRDYNPTPFRWMTSNPNPQIKIYWNSYKKL